MPDTMKDKQYVIFVWKGGPLLGLPNTEPWLIGDTLEEGTHDRDSNLVRSLMEYLLQKDYHPVWDIYTNAGWPDHIIVLKTILDNSSLDLLYW